MQTFLNSGPTERFGYIAVVGALGSPCALLLCHQPGASLTTGVFAWWAVLCLVSILNIEIWRRSAAALARRGADRDQATHRFERRQLLLSAAYVIGCAVRSIWPRADVQRFGLFDSWMSSVLVGRSVATVAELCFAIQWSLLLHRIAKDANCRLGVVISWLLPPLIVVAEICSWYAVLTTAYVGNAVEESLWALAGALLVIGCIAVWQRCQAEWRPILAVLAVFSSAYVAFMCAVDVPMYVSRFLADQAAGRQYLSLLEGLWDVGSRWTVTHSWEQWHPEIPWMTLYFSVGVWCSLALVHVPRIVGRPKAVATC